MDSKFNDRIDPSAFCRGDKERYRLETLLILCQQFQFLHNNTEGYPKIWAINDSHKLLNEFYWLLFKERIAPYVKNSSFKRINRYKIVSGLEIAIMRILPFRTKDDGLNKAINANFAFTVAKEILIFWGEYNTNLEISGFNEEHLIWLENLDTYVEIPIFSNAQTLRLYDYLLNIKQQVTYIPIHERANIIEKIREILVLKDISKQP